MEEDVWEALGYMLLYLEDIIKSEISHINICTSIECR